MADIIELILADHRRIRRLLGALEAGWSGTGSPAWRAGPVWRRLAEILVLHAEAEQEICYLALYGCGGEAAARLRDAIADDEDICAAVQEASLQAVASPAWWRAVTAVLRLSHGHMDEEEGTALACFARRAAPELRRELGQQWERFTAAQIGDTSAR
jgi:hypothetical protein